LMYRGRVAQAKRCGDMGHAQALYKAGAAGDAKAANAGALLNGFDATWRTDAGLLFARIDSLRKPAQSSAASALLEQLP
ncbi:lytic transglycosylase domain-containing protein, partial [Rhizobium ruizarguesonis]